MPDDRYRTVTHSVTAQRPRPSRTSPPQEEDREEVSVAGRLAAGKDFLAAPDGRADVYETEIYERNDTGQNHD
jgi:hypothetical protein